MICNQMLVGDLHEDFQQPTGRIRTLRDNLRLSVQRLNPGTGILVAGSGARLLDEVCYIAVEILEEAGRLHPTSDNNIYFTLNGAGKILAVGNSNPLSEELYVGNQRKVYRGRVGGG